MNRYGRSVLGCWFLLFLMEYGWTAPQDGFSLAVGGMAHAAHAQLVNDGLDRHFDSAGIALYGDAQFVVSPKWSFNPYVLTGLEKAHGDVTQNIGNSSGGLQLRHWWNNCYLGANVNYSIEQIFKGGSVQSATFGPGVGLNAGYETPAGLIFGLGVDFPQSLYLSPTNHRSGAWMVLGYRWH